MEPHVWTLVLQLYEYWTVHDEWYRMKKLCVWDSCNKMDNHGRWDLHPLLHSHEQATKCGLVWTWWACTEEGQNDMLYRQNYGDHIIELDGHFTPWVSISHKTSTSRNWKHYKPLFTASIRSYTTRTLSFCVTMPGHIQCAESRTTLCVSVWKFGIPHLFSEFGEESRHWIVSLAILTVWLSRLSFWLSEFLPSWHAA